MTHKGKEHIVLAAHRKPSLPDPAAQALAAALKWWHRPSDEGQPPKAGAAHATEELLLLFMSGDGGFLWVALNIAFRLKVSVSSQEQSCMNTVINLLWVFFPN